MVEKITKTQRWLDLVALLLGRKIPLTVEEIMERVPAYAEARAEGEATALATARRMFERDKDELRKAGIAIETVKYALNYGLEELEGYRIARTDFYLPYLRLLAAEDGDGIGDPPRPYPSLPEVEIGPEEAGVALDALRQIAELPAFPYEPEARSAMRKLTFDLRGEGYAGSPVVWVEQPGARELLARLRMLSDALLARKRVRFAYRGIQRGEVTGRDVAPYGLFFQRDWYLVGHDATRDALRVFRVARMEEIVANSKAPKQADFDVPPEFDLRDHLDRSAWELGDDDGAVDATVSFLFPLSLWAERNGHGELVSEDASGASVRRFRVAQPNPFVRWVLGMGGDACVESPPELRAECESLARELLALHGEGEPHG